MHGEDPVCSPMLWRGGRRHLGGREGGREGRTDGLRDRFRFGTCPNVYVSSDCLQYAPRRKMANDRC